MSVPTPGGLTVDQRRLWMRVMEIAPQAWPDSLHNHISNAMDKRRIHDMDSLRHEMAVWAHGQSDPLAVLARLD